MPLGGPMGPGGFRRGRRRGLVAGVAVGAAAASHANKKQAAANQPPAAPAPAPTTAPSQDVYAELEKLGKLKEQGILTQEEFDAKKKQLLGL